MGNLPQANQTQKLYGECFNDNVSKEEGIAMATAQLFDTLDQKMTERQMSLWVRTLWNFEKEPLRIAFVTVALTSTGFAKPEHVAKVVFDQEFLEDYSWLINNLKIHGPKWRDRPAELGEPRRGDSNDQASLYVRDVLAPAVKAPAIPERLREALYAFGDGDQARGLELLARHPFASGGEIDLREKRQLDEAFRAAWDGVRVRETAK